jgi:hypothetical protein
MDRAAGCVLPGDVDLVARPALTERLEGRKEPRVDRMLERTGRETGIQTLLDPC